MKSTRVLDKFCSSKSDSAVGHGSNVSEPTNGAYEIRSVNLNRNTHKTRYGLIS